MGKKLRVSEFGFQCALSETQMLKKTKPFCDKAKNGFAEISASQAAAVRHKQILDRLAQLRVLDKQMDSGGPVF